MSVTVRDVSAGYGGRVVVRDVGTVFSGVDMHIVIGPNGSGKSNLLRSCSWRFRAF